MPRGNIYAGTVRFYTPSGFPASASRALTMGAELVDSITLRHGLEEVSIGPSWWRRICSFTRYTRCSDRGAADPGLRITVIVDSIPGKRLPRNVLGADLVYELDSRRGTVLRISRGIRAWP